MARIPILHISFRLAAIPCDYVDFFDPLLFSVIDGNGGRIPPSRIFDC
jgi:hypothetical protein